MASTPVRVNEADQKINITNPGDPGISPSQKRCMQFMLGLNAGKVNRGNITTADNDTSLYWYKINNPEAYVNNGHTVECFTEAEGQAIVKKFDNIYDAINKFYIAANAGGLWLKDEANINAVYKAITDLVDDQNANGVIFRQLDDDAQTNQEVAAYKFDIDYDVYMVTVAALLKFVIAQLGKALGKQPILTLVQANNPLSQLLVKIGAAQVQ